MAEQKIFPSNAVIEALSQKNSEGLNRRDAMKMMAVGSTLGVLGIPPSMEAKEPVSSTQQATIVIVGGGTGGMIMLSRAHKALPHAKLILIAPNTQQLYQPGQTYVAAGLYESEDLRKETIDFIPKGTTWIKDEVASFEPDKNLVKLRAGREIAYDCLVVATGIVNHYEWIEGLSEADIGTHGIASVYLNDLAKATVKGAEQTWEWFQSLKDSASKKKLTVLYTRPQTPIKCGGVAQKILYLSADYLKQAGLGANFIYATSNRKLFFLPEIDKSLLKVQKAYERISNKFQHRLVAVDVKQKVATFEATFEIKGIYDRDLEAYEIKVEKKRVKIPYDFIHIVPPMAPPQAVIDSSLAMKSGRYQGWLEVDKETLQHQRYANVFGIGDVCGIPMGKTGGSARKQAPVVVKNLIAYLEQKKPRARYDGYTVCPIKAGYGSVMMVEFNYGGLAPSLPFLDPAPPRFLWWVFDRYLLKPVYWHLMLRGVV